MNTYFFNKLANLFGDTRNMIRKVNKLGVKLTRDPNHDNGKYSKFDMGGKSHGHINILSKVIFVPRNKKNELNVSPRFTFFHEAGHALSLKKKLGDDKFLYSNDHLHDYHPGYSLKKERKANRTALQHITDKKDRKEYIKHQEYPYSTHENAYVEEMTPWFKFQKTKKQILREALHKRNKPYGGKYGRELKSIKENDLRKKHYIV